MDQGLRKIGFPTRGSGYGLVGPGNGAAFNSFVGSGYGSMDQGMRLHFYRGGARNWIRLCTGGLGYTPIGSGYIRVDQGMGLRVYIVINWIRLPPSGSGFCRVDQASGEWIRLPLSGSGFH